MSFSPNLFWDADPAQLDFDANRRYVIERVVNRGTLDDLRTMFGLYGKATVADVVTGLRSLEPKALSFISCILDIPRDQFRCYTQRQSSQRHWIY